MSRMHPWRLRRFLRKVPCLFGKHGWKLIDIHKRPTPEPGSDGLVIKIRCQYCGREP